MLFEWRTARSSARRDSFPFPCEPGSSTTLAFPSPATPPPARSSPKRFRSQADVDGEGSGNLQKKKRRLRLNLITSRLSRPFATPTTHIVGRGSSKFATRFRQRIPGPTLLRKAAILNRIRIRRGVGGGALGFPLKDADTEIPHIATHEVDLTLVNERTDRNDTGKPSTNSNMHTPQSPSPLGLSTYDEYEEEVGMFDDPDWEDADTDSVYSDFTKREPVESSLDDCDFGASTILDPPHQNSPCQASAAITDLVMRGDRDTPVPIACQGVWENSF